MEFIGRKQELELLRECNWRSQALLTVIYGRRRIGKSRLVQEAYKGKKFIQFDGLEGLSEKEQLKHFLNQIRPHLELSKIPLPNKLESWHVALTNLAELIKANQEEDLIILFDEFQWMACMKPSFVSIFKSYWDNYYIKYKNLKFIICGSVSSFIVNKVLRSKALYGRIDHELFLQPFSCYETKEFLNSSFSKSEVLKIAMTFGGVPEYLEQLNPKLSIIQNLSTQAFSPHGYFFKEYQRIFLSHFGSSEIYEQITTALSTSALSHKDLEKKLETKSGGTFSSKINDLILAGFIEKYNPVDKDISSKLIYYRINDEYLHFYYSFIQKWYMQILRGEVVPEQILLGNNYNQWLGYSFERLCLKNSKMIADKLKFSGISYRSGSWFKRDISLSAQIDLLFIRADKVIVACEIKHSASIDAKKLAEQMERQTQALRKNFPGYAVQNILILAENIKVPNAVEKLFTYVFCAEELFLSDGWSRA